MHYYGEADAGISHSICELNLWAQVKLHYPSFERSMPRRTNTTEIVLHLRPFCEFIDVLLFVFLIYRKLALCYVHVYYFSELRSFVCR